MTPSPQPFWLNTCPLSAQDQNLFYAIERAEPLLVRRALGAGANPFSRDAAGYTPLIRAAHCMSSDCVKVLVAHGGLHLTSFGHNALHYAASTGYTPCVDALLRAGADPDAHPQDTGDTALMLAVWSNQPSCVKALISISTLSLRNAAGQTAFEYALSRDTRQAILDLFAAQHSFLEARTLHEATPWAYAQTLPSRI